MGKLETGDVIVSSSIFNANTRSQKQFSTVAAFFRRNAAAPCPQFPTFAVSARSSFVNRSNRRLSPIFSADSLPCAPLARLFFFFCLKISFFLGKFFSRRYLRKKGTRVRLTESFKTRRRFGSSADVRSGNASTESAKTGTPPELVAPLES